MGGVRRQSQMSVVDAAAPWADRIGARQCAAVGVAAMSVAAVRARQRIGVPRALASVCAFGVPAVIAAGFGRSRARDGAVWAAQMWAYKNAFEMPADDEARLRRRTHFDYPIAVDARIGAGTPRASGWPVACASAGG